jgi:hypothetical protein
MPASIFRSGWDGHGTLGESVTLGVVLGEGEGNTLLSAENVVHYIGPVWFPEVEDGVAPGRCERDRAKPFNDWADILERLGR